MSGPFPSKKLSTLIVFITIFYCTEIKLSTGQLDILRWGIIFMTMEILNDFNIEIVNESPIYKVVYTLDNYSGTCVYTETPPQSKIQSGNIYLLTHSDMGDVIEYIHKKTPLTSDKFSEVQMGIREHSLNQLKEFVITTNSYNILPPPHNKPVVFR